MGVVVCTLCLNEMEHLPALYEQHKKWPEMWKWVFVEAADRVFAETNPDLVSPKGLSVDGTSLYLAHLAAKDPSVEYIPHGISSHANPAQGKCEARQRYLDVAETLHPDFLVILDADEFYTFEAQRRLTWLLKQIDLPFRSFRCKQRDIWRPASIKDVNLFSYEVSGGYWAVRHCRFWRWERGLRYELNHNWPQDSQNVLLNRPMYRFDTKHRLDAPECIHLGFASTASHRAAKHRYYEFRGESVSRSMYTDCRLSWERWVPGQQLPHGARVRPYRGPIPEVFLGSTLSPHALQALT